MKAIGDHFLYCLLHMYLPKSSPMMVLSFIIFWGEPLRKHRPRWLVPLSHHFPCCSWCTLSPGQRFSGPFAEGSMASKITGSCCRDY